MKNIFKKSVVTKNPTYRATLSILGKRYESFGETISDAIQGLAPGNCKGKAILTLEHGEIRKERVLMPVAAFRLFNTSGLSREIALKNTSLLFQGL